VELKGEAFFDVVPMEGNPFIVNLERDLVVQVLGTSFHIRPEEVTGDVKVQVLAGLVEFFKAGRAEEKMILAEGEQGTFNEESGFSKSGTVDENDLSWKTGELVFKVTPLREVVEDLMQYSGKTILLQGEGLDTLTLTTRITNHPPLTEILEEIRDISHVDYDSYNDTIILFPEQGNKL
jgi:transmembrane sensor